MKTLSVWQWNGKAWVELPYLVTSESASFVLEVSQDPVLFLAVGALPPLANPKTQVRRTKTELLAFRQVELAEASHS